MNCRRRGGSQVTAEKKADLGRRRNILSAFIS